MTIYRWVQTFTPKFTDAAGPGPRSEIGGSWKNLRQGRQPLVLPLPRGRSVQPGHRRHGVAASRRRRSAARCFARALRHGPAQVEVLTERAPAYPRVLDGHVATARHVTEQYANNAIKADHGRLKARLGPMRALKRPQSARTITAGHAFLQNCAAATTQ